MQSGAAYWNDLLLLKSGIYSVIVYSVGTHVHKIHFYSILNSTSTDHNFIAGQFAQIFVRGVTQLGDIQTYRYCTVLP